MAPIFNVDESGGKHNRWARGIFLGGNLPVIVTGESRTSLYTRLVHLMQRCKGWDVKEHQYLYVYYGRYWRSFMDDEAALAKTGAIEAIKRSMEGPAAPTIAKAVSRKRRFIYFSDKTIPNPLFKLQDRVRQTMMVHPGPGQEQHVTLKKAIDSVRDSKN